MEHSETLEDFIRSCIRDYDIDRATEAIMSRVDDELIGAYDSGVEAGNNGAQV